jgi:hypothetical protein
MKSQFQFGELRKSEFIKEDMDETVFMFAFFLSNLLAANGLSKPFEDGKSTGDSCFSGARECSSLDGTK